MGPRDVLGTFRRIFRLLQKGSHRTSSCWRGVHEGCDIHLTYEEDRVMVHLCLVLLRIVGEPPEQRVRATPDWWCSVNAVFVRNLTADCHGPTHGSSSIATKAARVGCCAHREVRLILSEILTRFIPFSIQCYDSFSQTGINGIDRLIQGPRVILAREQTKDTRFPRHGNCSALLPAQMLAEPRWNRFQPWKPW